MKKVKFKFKCLMQYGGGIRTLIITIDCPVFKEIPGRKFNGIQLPATSVEEQLESWLDNQDKLKIMDENDIDIIIDYHVYTTKKKESFRDFVYRFKDDMTEQTMLDIIHLYQSKKDSLRGLSHAKKLEMLLMGVSIGYEAQAAFAMRIRDILRGDREPLNDGLENNHHKVMSQCTDLSE